MNDKKAESELKTLYQITGEIADINTILVNRGEFHRLQVDLERERMRLFACGVVAMADTPDSAREARAMHPDYESASCDDVKRRVDECIALRARVAELEDVLTNLPLSSPQRLRARIQRLEEMLAAVGAGGVGPLMPITVQHQGKSSGDNELQRKTGDLITTAAPPQSGGIPPDWKLVPVKPTRGMLDAARKDLVRDAEIDPMLKGIHSAMLAAAPQPQAVEQTQDDQEPVAWIWTEWSSRNVTFDGPPAVPSVRDELTKPVWTPLYTHQQPEREPLTESEERQAFEVWCHSAGLMQQSHGIVSISSHTDTAWKAWQARANGIWGEA